MDSVEICNALKLVEVKEHNKIITFLSKTKDIDILFSWYNENIDFGKNTYYIRDYINMSKQLNFYINLNITSLKRFIKEHDNLAIEISLQKADIEINISKKYLNNKIPFKLLDSMSSLIYEGKIQKHCVASYFEKINLGKCAIYTDKYDGNKYTIELVEEKGKYFLKQVQGKFNSPPPKEYLKEINRKIKILNMN